jgi:hypothetical protein
MRFFTYVSLPVAQNYKADYQVGMACRARRHLLVRARAHPRGASGAVVSSMVPMPDSKKPPRGPRAGADLHLLSTRERLLPSLDARPRVVMSGDEISALELSDAARRALPYFDGKTTVHDLLEVVGGVDNLFDVLDELVHEGVIALSRR